MIIVCIYTCKWNYWSGALAAGTENNGKIVVFTNCAPFTDCIKYTST